MRIHRLHIAFYVTALFFEIVADCRKEFRLPQPMRGPGRYRNETTADFMLPLRAGLETLFVRIDTILDLPNVPVLGLTLWS